MSVRRSVAAVALVALLVFVVSCGLFGGDDPTPTPATPPEVTVEAPTVAAAVAATEVPATTAPTTAAVATQAAAAPTATTAAAEPTATAVAEETEEEVDIPSLDALEAVDTYEAAMVMRLTRTDDETVITAVEMFVKLDRLNSAQHVAITSTEEGQEPMSIEMVTIGADSWMSFGEGWMHTKSDEESVGEGAKDFMTVGGNVLDSIEKPELVNKGEVVNGMTTDHYRFEESELSGMEFMSVSEASGEVWVSQEGDYVVKMVMNGAGTMPGDDDTEVATNMTMTFELLSVNQPLTIEPPAGFSAEDMLPVMEGALTTSNYFSTAGMAMYEVKATPEEVLEWYKETLTADGWEMESEDETEGMSSANFTKDDATLSVMVLPSEIEDAVSVMVTKS